MHEGQFTAVVSSDGTLMPVSGNGIDEMCINNPHTPAHTGLKIISSQLISTSFVLSWDMKQSTFSKKKLQDPSKLLLGTCTLTHIHTSTNTRPCTGCSEPPTNWNHLFTQCSHVGFQTTVTWEQGNFLWPCLPHSYCPWLKIKAVWVHSKHNQPRTSTQTL